MDDDDFGAEHNWTFQEEKMLHESKSQDWFVTGGALLTLGIVECSVALGFLHWIGVIK